MLPDNKKITNGMFNALQKMEQSGKICPACNFNIPKYPGAYPKTCPHCGSKILDKKVDVLNDMIESLSAQRSDNARV